MYPVNLAQEDDEVDFQCKATTETEADNMEVKDEIEFKIRKFQDGLKVKVEYEQEIETEETETESETSYEITFDRLIEYEKGAASSVDDAYDWENDEIIQGFLLDTLGGFTTVVDSSDGVTASFSVATQETGDFMVEFTFTISQASFGEAVTANKMKIDFEVKNFPWIQDNTFVALISSVESKREVEIDYDDDEESSDTSKKAEDVIIDFSDALDGTGVNVFGEYTWDKSAVAMSNETMADAKIEVVATSPLTSESGVQSIAFSFIGEPAMGAADIYWDPEAGIGYGATPSSSTMYGIFSSVLLAAVALM